METIEALLDNKLVIALISLLFTLLTVIANHYHSSIKEKLQDLKSVLDEHSDDIQLLNKDISKLDRKHLEYQIVANSTFVMKEDFQEAKENIRRLSDENSNSRQ